jgi:hypothetical protein
MKKIFLLALAVLFTVTFLQAQNRGTNSSSYTNALGVKVWDGAGISFKHFFNSNNAGELIGYFWSQVFVSPGFLKFTAPSQGRRVEMVYWPGVHIGFYNTKYGGASFAGIDGVLGLDYKFKGAPINMSLDWQPSFEFGDNRGFVGSWGGLGIRYTF